MSLVIKIFQRGYRWRKTAGSQLSDVSLCYPVRFFLLSIERFCNLVTFKIPSRCNRKIIISTETSMLFVHLCFKQQIVFSTDTTSYGTCRIGLIFVIVPAILSFQKIIYIFFIIFTYLVGHQMLREIFESFVSIFKLIIHILSLFLYTTLHLWYMSNVGN